MIGRHLSVPLERLLVDLACLATAAVADGWRLARRTLWLTSPKLDQRA